MSLQIADNSADERLNTRFLVCHDFNPKRVEDIFAHGFLSSLPTLVLGRRSTKINSIWNWPILRAHLRQSTGLLP